MDEIAETIVYEEDNEDSTEALLKQYDDGKKCSLDDVAAMQTLLCVLAAAGLFAAEFFYPETAGAIFEKFKMHITDTACALPNPIDILLSHLQNR